MEINYSHASEKKKVCKKKLFIYFLRSFLDKVETISGGTFPRQLFFFLHEEGGSERFMRLVQIWTEQRRKHTQLVCPRAWENKG